MAQCLNIFSLIIVIFIGIHIQAKALPYKHPFNESKNQLKSFTVQINSFTTDINKLNKVRISN